MDFKEYDLVKTKVEKAGYPVGTKGVVVSIYTGYPVCEVEIWNERNYPIDVVSYYFSELEFVERDDKSSK